MTSGLVALLLGVFLTYVAHVVIDQRSFAERAARSVRDPAVNYLLADRLSQIAIDANRDLTAYRPLVFAAARQVVRTDAFAWLLRAGAQSLHFVALSRGGKDLLLTLADGGILLESALPNLPPRYAARIPDDLVVPLASAETLARALPGLRAAAVCASAAGWLVVGGVVLLLMASMLSPAPWRVGRETGWLLIFTGILFLLVRYAGAALIRATVDEDRIAEAAAGVWLAFFADAVVWCLILVGVGGILVSSSAALGARVRALWQWLKTEPAHPSGRLARAVAFVVVGGAAIRWPGTLAEVVVVVAGSAVLALGVSALGHLVFRSERVERTARALFRPAVIVICFAASLFGIGLWFHARARPASTQAVVVDACNGHGALCSRPLDRVVFAATHNSMASGDQPTWFFPAQESDIRTQLRDGIRGFQIDVHYGYQVGNRVLTVIDDDGKARQTYEAVLGKEGIEAAFRIRSRLLGQPRGARRLYLCHGFCELGAIELGVVFRWMRDFLRTHPNEVLLIVVQDEDVNPDDIARVAEETGLAELVYRGPVTGPWPTLGEMIAQKQQVVIVAENNPGDVPWYHPAFEVFQETPFDVREAADFSCEPWRGGTRGTLFQLNHWITRVPAPRPSDAARVNAYDFLMPRVQACMRRRHMVPNLLAVDHYRTGDLFEVVDELNRADEQRRAVPQ
ncbi:MAG: hypothetical protein SFX73_12260 [Kofleriaceae bacterium]|nr:hypothetical protein [Kofleriaceae bacterium]